MGENTSPGFRLLGKSNGQLEDAPPEGVPPSVWRRIPPEGRVLVTVLLLLGGGGSAVLAFLRPSVVTALGVVPAETYSADMQKIEERFGKLEAQGESNTGKIIQAVEKARGKR